ncbi:F-box domain, cyclin-like protein [Artemisia annua]|uniref:F-box domain, cyclin-like protein n=1 Tax=Artemisia annua TaxID=35608 RepID=A0A2U1Q474_ARTAN|nr:F-box domain, cyclin-like protein [Artemisia annua]
MFHPFDAIRTRILSNRWKNLYAFLPNLSFVMRHHAILNKFYDFVDRTLAIRGDIPVQRFYLNCEYKCDYGRVYNLLSTLVGQFKVQQLILIFSMERYMVAFCWDLFRTCETLVELTLVGHIVLDVPEECGVLFPCLKKINLVSVVYSGDHSLANLVSGCPVLDELFVERRVFPDGLMMFKVSSVSLKRLKLSFSEFHFGDYKVVVDAPNLEYLYVYDNMTNQYSLTNLVSLVEADIYHDAKTIPEIIPFLLSAN